MIRARFTSLRSLLVLAPRESSLAHLLLLLLLPRQYCSCARDHSNRQSTFSPLTQYLNLPKYFDSEWSYAQYRIPSQSAHISISAQPAKSPTADVVDEEKCVVGWIQVSPEDHQLEPGRPPPAEYQLVALTYTGGWYRLSLPTSTSSQAAAVPSPSSYSPGPAPSVQSPLSTSPPSVRTMPVHRPRSSSGSSFTSRPDKGKEREREEKPGRECILREFRRFGRWDGWG